MPSSDEHDIQLISEIKILKIEIFRAFKHSDVAFIPLLYVILDQHC